LARARAGWPRRPPPLPPPPRGRAPAPAGDATKLLWAEGRAALVLCISEPKKTAVRSARSRSAAKIHQLIYVCIYLHLRK
jgi:hypothetical protein